ncbi:MAG TPA: glycosyltransferase [Candidatus Methylomirabilis sp.]|nr:glycosyltransferase [Candidatus Methylomirabilis sp.]
MGEVSVVIPSHNEGENLVDTVDCVLANSSTSALEVLVVDDGSTDGSGERVSMRFATDRRVRVVRTSELGVAGARNLGARQSTGHLLVFLDGHCYTPPGWLPTLTEPLADPAVGMIGPAFTSLEHGNGARGLGVTWRGPSLEIEWLPQQQEAPYPVPLLPGGCQAMRRADFEALGRYDGGMTRWGSEDVELSLRVWLMGYQVLVQPAVLIYHLFRQRHPYPVDGGKVLYNRLRMALLHLSEERVARVIDSMKDWPEFAQSLIWLLGSDVVERRRYYQAHRPRDDEWFCRRFSCPI